MQSTFSLNVGHLQVHPLHKLGQHYEAACYIGKILCTMERVRVALTLLSLFLWQKHPATPGRQGYNALVPILCSVCVLGGGWSLEGEATGEWAPRAARRTLCRLPLSVWSRRAGRRGRLWRDLTSRRCDSPVAMRSCGARSAGMEKRKLL